MKKFAMGALATIVSTLAMSAQAFGQAEGNWRTATQETGASARVNVTQCAGSDNLCGTITRVYNASDDSNVGLMIIRDMEPMGTNKWGNGKIYDPVRDMNFNATMELNGNSLTVKGCFLVICDEQTWTRM